MGCPASSEHRSPLPTRVVAGLTVALTALVSATPRPASASPDRAEAKGAKADEAALAEAKALFERGKAKYDTYDFEGAVELWTQAYSKLPEDAAGQRNAMVYNIATAREKAYEVDKDLQHLRQAQLLLESYVANYKAMYQRTPETEAEVKKAEDKIEEIKQRIAAGGDAGGQTTSEAVGPLVFDTGHNPPPDPALVEKNAKLRDEGRKADSMIIAGYVVGSIGLLALLSAAGGFGAGAAADATEDEGARRAGRLTGFTSLGFGLAATATGATLLGVGFSKRKKLQRGEIAFTPSASPTMAGGVVTVRF